jgi:hypothetical protein
MLWILIFSTYLYHASCGEFRPLAAWRYLPNSLGRTSAQANSASDRRLRSSARLTPAPGRERSAPLLSAHSSRELPPLLKTVLSEITHRQFGEESDGRQRRRGLAAKGTCYVRCATSIGPHFRAKYSITRRRWHLWGLCSLHSKHPCSITPLAKDSSTRRRSMRFRNSFS